MKKLSFSRQEHFTSSIEPGYYEEGAFGIRIENVAVVVKAFSRGDIDWFTFDPVTFVPLSAKMIDMSLLTPDEVGWVDDYHVSHSYSSTGVQKLISTLDPIFWTSTDSVMHIAVIITVQGSHWGPHYSEAQLSSWKPEREKYPKMQCANLLPPKTQALCWEKVSPRLSGKALDWLKKNTMPLVTQVYGEDV